MNKKSDQIISEQCRQQIRALTDTMELLSGKWKIVILGTLLRNGTLRFMELKRVLDGIAPKKLSKDLQELELNQLVRREVKDTKPITVEYSLTDHGRTLDVFIGEAIHWGLEHRKEIIKQDRNLYCVHRDKEFNDVLADPVIPNDDFKLIIKIY